MKLLRLLILAASAFVSLLVAAALWPLIAGPAQQMLLAHKATAGGGGGSPSYLYSGAAADDMSGIGSDTTFSPNSANRNAITVPGTGTITQLGFYLGSTINAGVTLKMALLDASLNQVGSTYTISIPTGGATNEWRSVATSISVSAGTYYIAYIMDGPYVGAIYSKYTTTGTTYYVDPTDYGAFYAGGYSWSTAGGFSWSVRAQYTP